MKFKAIDLQHLDMITAQAEMILTKQRHKRSGNKEILNFLLPKDKRNTFHKVYSKQPLHEEISEATDRDFSHG